MKSGIGAQPFGYRNLYYDVSSDEQMVKSGIQIASRVQAENRLKWQRDKVTTWQNAGALVRPASRANIFPTSFARLYLQV